MTIPSVIIAHGPRAVEELLLEKVEALRPQTDAELAFPVRIVVPSKSLRLHLSEVLVRRRGALAGVVVQTLHAVALEILERDGHEPPWGSSAQEILIRRLASGERVLRDALDHLEDGYGSMTGTVRDLIDAGFEPAHEEPTLEKLSEIGAVAVVPPVLARAGAVVRVAARVGEATEHLGVSGVAVALRRAEAALVRDPQRALPSRHVIVHGFADATGLAVELLLALMRHRPASVFLDRPPDPLQPDREDPGACFSDRFRERISSIAEIRDNPAGLGETSRLELLVAPDLESEARGVAVRVRELLVAGCRPEAVAVVARDLRTYTAALRRHFDRLGVPCSAVGARVASPLAVRCRALSAVLAEGGRTPVELWLAAVAEPGTSSDILLGLRALGLGLVEDLARLGEADLRSVTLPMLVGWREGDGGGHARRRRLPKEQLGLWWQRARATVDAFASWPQSAPARVHLRQSLKLLEAAQRDQTLEWLIAARKALQSVAADLAPGWHLSRQEWVLLACGRLDAEGSRPLGGDGGGVQVLSVMEARARTFDALFVLGLNRDVFPRVVREDALLPDAVRARLLDVLDQVPIKERGWDEERYLFAQLLAAADRVALSWHRGAGGKETAPSPFVARLRGVVGVTSADLPGLWQAGTDDGVARPAFEHAVLSGLAGDRQRWLEALSVALTEGYRRVGAEPSVGTFALARARRELVDELDPVEERRDLGPLSGCVGAAAEGDPRRRGPSVTMLEAVARCPWQTFITRLLGVAPAPDPLLDLPAASAVLVGAVVHRVLEAVVGRVVEPGGDVAATIARGPVAVSWPDNAELEAMIDRAARRVAGAEGLAHLGIDRVLVELARPFLEVARRTDWPDDGAPPQVLGAEVSGTAPFPILGLDLAFRADRLDGGGEEVVFTDYKTGRPVSQPKLLEQLARGEALQIAAYCAGAGGGHGRGRYLYLRPDPKQPEAKATARVFDSDDGATMQLLDRAVEVLVQAWRRGAFVPRLADRGGDGDGPACRYCEVEQACLRSDSGFRRRLLAWRERRPVAGAVDEAAWRLWWLGSTTGEGGDS